VLHITKYRNTRIGHSGKTAGCSASRSINEEHSPSCDACNTCGDHDEVWGLKGAGTSPACPPTAPYAPDLCQGDTLCTISRAFCIRASVA